MTARIPPVKNLLQREIRLKIKVMFQSETLQFLHYLSGEKMREAAKANDMANSTFSNILNWEGKAADPNSVYTRRLCGYYGISHKRFLKLPLKKGK